MEDSKNQGNNHSKNSQNNTQDNIKKTPPARRARTKSTTARTSGNKPVTGATAKRTAAQNNSKTIKTENALSEVKNKLKEFNESDPHIAQEEKKEILEKVNKGNDKHGESTVTAEDKLNSKNKSLKTDKQKMSNKQKEKIKKAKKKVGKIEKKAIKIEKKLKKAKKKKEGKKTIKKLKINFKNILKKLKVNKKKLKKVKKA